MIVQLKDCIETAFIVAYREDTEQLEQALRREGLAPVVLRASYVNEELEFSRATRCLLNHGNAWKKCAESNRLNLVIEADFVPVRGFGCLPLPFNLAKKEISLGWLYCGGARLYRLDEHGFAVGFAACPVATVVGPQAARILVDFVAEQLRAHDPREYFAWDIYYRHWAKEQGVASYLPYRSYGEHGGLTNPEHQANGITPEHRADVLWGRLHFPPAYARGSMTRFLAQRLKHKSKGFARLISGRYIEWPILKSRSLSVRQKLQMIWFSVIRLLSIR